MNKLVLLLPGALIPIIGISVVANSVASTAGPMAAAAACVYANPSAERITATMEKLTTTPVDDQHWDAYAVDAGYDGIDYQASSLDERHQVLLRTVRTILNTVPQATLTAPPIIWWHGAMPGDDTDLSWQNTPVNGWDGDLDSYIAAFANTYAVDPDVLAIAAANPTSCAPIGGSLCPQPTDVSAILATIRSLESGDNYTEHHRAKITNYAAGSGWPSGAYQFIYSTWNKYAGYDEAFNAPPAIQDERAASDVNSILAELGSVEWVPVAWYVGTEKADKIKNGEIPLTWIPNPAHNTISIGDYQTRWMTRYTTASLPAAGLSATPCPQGAPAVIAWAESQIGAPWVAFGKYRYGTPLWPGGTLRGDKGDLYTFPAGTAVYDCSGFVITAWAKAGLDFRNQGIHYSQAFKTTALPDADRNALQPGDIAVYGLDPKSGIGHVVLIHHVDPDGTVRTIEASSSKGVHIGTLQWNRVIAIKHPTLPAG